MDAILVRLARAIACHARLRILCYLARHGETIPTVLADKLDITLPTLSIHMRVLSTSGLVVSRKSGPNCYYSATSPYGAQTLSGRISEWLGSVLTDARTTGSQHDELIYSVLSEAATAFTELRRLQILRRLLVQGPATVDALRNELGMSPSAVNRHTSKLCRRGYLAVATNPEGSIVVAIAPACKSAIHNELFEIVQRTWQQRRFQPSESP